MYLAGGIPTFGREIYLNQWAYGSTLQILWRVEKMLFVEGKENMDLQSGDNVTR
jgi:hypothetical protein